MKRLIALVLGFVLVIGCAPVMADGQTDSTNMEAALIAVKSKVDIPDELTEFYSSSYVSEDKVTYSFFWSNKEGTSTIDIGCDEHGRIGNYHYYSNNMNIYSEGKKLAGVTREEVINCANAFISKLFPETNISENDKIVCDEKNISAYVFDSGTMYTVPYRRMKDGIYVDGNTASIELTAVNKDITVTSAYCSYNYESPFKNETMLADFDYKAAYKQNFPAELVYIKNYRDDKTETKLVYRFKDSIAGYISAALGEPVEIDSSYKELYREFFDASAEDASNEKMAAGGLNLQEITELNTVAGLKTAQEIEQSLRGISVLKLDKNMKLQENHVFKYDENYFMNLNFYEDGDDYKRVLHVKVDAKTGDIKSIYNYGDKYNEGQATEQQKAKAEKAIDSFMSSYAGDEYKLCKGNDTYYEDMAADKTYVRYHEGVPVLGESITVSYDMKDDMITSYNKNIDNALVFESADGVLGDKAYDSLTAVAPIESVYVLSGGEYTLCYSANANNYVQIDAKTGDKYSPYENNAVKADYNDIDSHWCKNAVEKLAEVGIALPGGSFNPDSAITQEDLLRFFVSGMEYVGYMSSSTDNLYSVLYNMGILSKEERSETASVSREDAFVYMIRFAHLEKVAKLSKIFTVEFKDKNLITPEKIGYASILSGMGIISGDSGVRPLDNITRAEAASMLYNYLTLN